MWTDRGSNKTMPFRSPQWQKSDQQHGWGVWEGGKGEKKYVSKKFQNSFPFYLDKCFSNWFLIIETIIWPEHSHLTPRKEL